MGRWLRLAPIPVYLTRPGDHVNVPYAPCARAHRLKDRIRRAHPGPANSTVDVMFKARTLSLDNHTGLRLRWRAGGVPVLLLLLDLWPDQQQPPLPPRP